MDLIDLDRVLDEFEAKEELHSSAHSSTTISAKPAAQSVIHHEEEKQPKSLDSTNGLGRRKLDSSSSSDGDIEPKRNGAHDHSTDPEPCLVDLAEPAVSAPVLEPSVFWNGTTRELVPLVPSKEAAATGLEESAPKPSSVSPPDVANIGENGDQEPEDPKTSPAESLEAQPAFESEQHPPPDVVAGHVITRSGSSTPSPTPMTKRPIGFYEDNEEGSNDRITEEDLERYLSELEEKIGESNISYAAAEGVGIDYEENRHAPSSEELKSYLENLEKISGETLAINTEHLHRSSEEKDEPIATGHLTEEKEVRGEKAVLESLEPGVERAKATPESSSAESASTEKPASNSIAPLPHTDDDDVVVDKEENRTTSYHNIDLDEDDSDEDPYVLLAFSSAHGPENLKANSGDEQQTLKAEIEQALLASNVSAENFLTGPTATVEKPIAEEDVQAAIESSGDSFVVCPEPPSTASSQEQSTDGSLNDRKKPENEVRDGNQTEVLTVDHTAPEAAPEQSSNAGTSTGDETIVPAAEASVSTAAAASKGQLVTICRLDASPSSELPSGNTPLKLTESELQLGRVAPVWIPDNDSPVCMLCESKFTIIRRRHHCRACGRVLCNVCCNQRAKLPYMTAVAATKDPGSNGNSGKNEKQRQQDARVCNSCFERLKRIEDHEKQPVDNAQGNDVAQSTSSQTAASAEQNVATASASATASSAGAAAAVPSPVTRPPVLKREGSTVRRSEPKQVMFSDGIKPGGDLTETPPSSVTTPSQPVLPAASTAVTSKPGGTILSRRGNSSPKGIRSRELECFFTLPGAATTSDEAPQTLSWPPIITEKGELIYVSDEGVAAAFADLLENDESTVITFALKRNLRVMVRLTQINCCLNRVVWCFATDGLRNVSQDELLIVIERCADSEASKAEATPPLDIFVYFNVLYDEALKGKPLGDLSYTVFSQSGMHPVDATKGYFGSKDNAGFLHFRPTYQCLQHLCLPEQPFLVGVLIQKSEVSWAKVMPLRLLLRLGVEYRYYPYPLLSDRSRKTLFYETGHTIMNLLTDMRNFTYSLPSIPGCTVALEDDKTVIMVPMDQYNQVLKILQSSNEHVLAWAASLHKSADAHLVCVQQPDTLSYTSQTINRENHGRKLTGACFVVFNASLKAGGAPSRISIVEDGLMIQIRPESMERLRQSLHQQQSFDLIPSNPGPEKPSSDGNANVEIRWIPVAEKMSRYALRSRIDGRNLTDVPRYRLHGKTVESTNGRKLIRLIELYLLRDDEDNSGAPGEPDDLQSMVRQVATACGNALLPFVDILDDANMKTIAVRFAMGADLVEYSAGSNEQPLADPVMSGVDDALIPLLHSRAMGGGNGNDGNLRIWRVELVMRLLDLG